MFSHLVFDLANIVLAVAVAAFLGGVALATNLVKMRDAYRQGDIMRTLFKGGAFSLATSVVVWVLGYMVYMLEHVVGALFAAL